MIDLSDIVIDHIFPLEKMLTLHTLTVSELLEELRYEAYKERLQPSAEHGGEDFNPSTMTHPIMQAFLRFQAAKLGVTEVFDAQFPGLRHGFLNMWHKFPRRDAAFLEQAQKDTGTHHSTLVYSKVQEEQWESDTLALDGWLFEGLCLFSLGEDELDARPSIWNMSRVVQTNFRMLQTGCSRGAGSTRFDEIHVSVVDMGGPNKNQVLKVSTQAFERTVDNAVDFANLMLGWTGLICTRLCQILAVKDYCLTKGVKVGVSTLDNIRFTFWDGEATSIALTGVKWRDLPKRIDFWAHGRAMISGPPTVEK